MATGAAIAGVAISAVGSKKAAKSQSEADKEAEAAQRAAVEEQQRLDAMNIEFSEQELAEELRRATQEMVTQVGQSKTLSGASGFGEGSSLDRYTEDLTSRYQSDISWMNQGGQNSLEMMRQESDARAKTGNTQAGLMASQSKANYSNSKWSTASGIVSGAAGAANTYSKVGWGW